MTNLWRRSLQLQPERHQKQLLPKTQWYSVALPHCGTHWVASIQAHHLGNRTTYVQWINVPSCNESWWVFCVEVYVCFYSGQDKGKKLLPYLYILYKNNKILNTVVPPYIGEVNTCISIYKTPSRWFAITHRVSPTHNKFVLTHRVLCVLLHVYCSLVTASQPSPETDFNTLCFCQRHS